MNRPFRSWIALPLGAMIASLAIGLLSADNAHASCGDYLMVGETHGGSMPSHEPSPERPCHGPNCSGVPHSAPLAPAPWTSPHRQHDPAARVTDAAIDLFATSAPLDFESSRGEIARPEHIFRPPR
jgi:hypothetical protein